MIIEPEILSFYSIIFGLLIGSFLTVCIYRIPYGRIEGPPTNLSAEAIEKEEEEEEEKLQKLKKEKKLSVNFPPRSFCPKCDNQLLWWHNIPFFSWILLKGKCHFCKAKIPAMYPIVEALSAIFCFLSFRYFDIYTAPLIYIFCAALIVISFIDIKYYIIPNVITFSGMAIGLAIGAVNQFTHMFSEPLVQNLWGCLWGFLCGGGILYVVSEGYMKLRGKMGLGMGDVKLLALIGLCFGPHISLSTIFIGSLAGSIIGGLYLLIAKDLAKPLPFGPYLAVGALIAIFCEVILPGGLPLFKI